MLQDCFENAIRDLKDGRNSVGNFQWIFERYYASVVRYFKRNGIHEDSEDLAQEVFLVVYNSIRDLRDAIQFPGWLFSISRSILLNEIDRRHAKKRCGLYVRIGGDSEAEEEAFAHDGFPDRNPGSDPLAVLLDREEYAKLNQAVHELPVQMRRCVLLRLRGSSYADIATLMGISINTVKAHLHQAKTILVEKLRPYFGAVQCSIKTAYKATERLMVR